MHILMYLYARYNWKLWKVYCFYCVFLGIFIHNCLICCIPIKLSQILSFINIHRLVCQYAKITVDYGQFFDLMQFIWKLNHCNHLRLRQSRFYFGIYIDRAIYKKQNKNKPKNCLSVGFLELFCRLWWGIFLYKLMERFFKKKLQANP